MITRDRREPYRLWLGVGKNVSDGDGPVSSNFRQGVVNRLEEFDNVKVERRLPPG